MQLPNAENHRSTNGRSHQAAAPSADNSFGLDLFIVMQHPPARPKAGPGASQLWSRLEIVPPKLLFCLAFFLAETRYARIFCPVVGPNLSAFGKLIRLLWRAGMAAQRALGWVAHQWVPPLSGSYHFFRGM